MLPLLSTWAHETGLSTEAGISKLWDITVPIISGTYVDVVCSSLPQHGPGESMSVLGYCISNYYFVDGPHGPHRPGHGLGSRLRLPGRYFKDPMACLRCGTTD